MSLTISPKWLQSYCQIDATTEQLASMLSDSGFETEVIDDLYIDPKLVIGEVLQVEKHPNADKLNLCKVDIGGEVLSIVCGCPTVPSARLVIVAPVVSTLPGMILKPVKLRGVDSEGMICSLQEIGLVEEGGKGIYHVKEDLSAGQRLIDVLEHDARLLDIDVTPNRGDCLSVYGIARDLAASQKATLSSYPSGIDLGLVVKSSELLGRMADGVSGYDAMTGTLDRTASPPLYMINRLRQAGMGLNHVVVDILNYVMLEIGQPMHAFDQRYLDGPLSVTQGGEQSLKLLNDEDYKPKAWDLMVCDQKGPQALAGIMGGMDSRMLPDSDTIQLESAVFFPRYIAKSLRNCQLNSDASYRYERGVSIDLNQTALAYAAKLLERYAGASFTAYQSYKLDAELVSVSISVDKINRYLGTTIREDEVQDILQRLGMDVSANWKVSVPSYRYDVSMDVDIIEEVARLYGYNNIALEPMHSELNPAPLSRDTTMQCKQAMVQAGYQEVVQFSFVSEQLINIFQGEGVPVVLRNPIHAEYNYMRTHIWQSLILAAQHNYQRQITDMKLFEVGETFSSLKDEISEPTSLGAICIGQVNHGYGHHDECVDYYTMQSLARTALSAYGIHQFLLQECSDGALHPKQSANIVSEGVVLGTIGMLNPNVCQVLSLPDTGLMVLHLDRLASGQQNPIRIPSKYPAVSRDVTITVGLDVKAGDMQNDIVSADIPYLKTIVLQDIYSQSSDAVNITWRIGFQSSEKTLSDKSVEKSMLVIRGLLDNYTQS